MIGTEGGKRVVEKLKCKVCAKFAEGIRGTRNFSEKWIVGVHSVHTSNLHDHARNDQHAYAMSLLNNQRAESLGLGLASYAPIAKALNTLSEDERKRLKVKFDIEYFVATEKLPYMKYPKICELEVCHGVKIGTSYRHDNVGKDFMHYIAKQNDMIYYKKSPLSCLMGLPIKATSTTKSC